MVGVAYNLKLIVHQITWEDQAWEVDPVNFQIQPSYIGLALKVEFHIYLNGIVLWLNLVVGDSYNAL